MRAYKLLSLFLHLELIEAYSTLPYVPVHVNVVVRDLSDVDLFDLFPSEPPLALDESAVHFSDPYRLIDRLKVQRMSQIASQSVHVRLFHTGHGDTLTLLQVVLAQETL